MGVREAKRALRRRVKVWRDTLPPEERDQLSAHVARRVFALDTYRRARCVAAYAAFGSEVATAAIAARVLEDGKALAMARVEGETLVLHRVRDPSRDLVAGTWGIPEPAADLPVVDPGAVELFLLPGLVFDAKGGRIGYGRGYFDRVLAAASGVKVALAFDGQLVEAVPVAPRDVAMDKVVTPTRVIRCRTGADDPRGAGRP